jgi:predicted dehydrogenase
MNDDDRNCRDSPPSQLAICCSLVKMPGQVLGVAIIGLSRSSGSGWAEDAHLPALWSLSEYKIVALLNSSVAAAEKAIVDYALPPHTKPYGDPEDVAKDPTVDVVICAVRADKHYATIIPSIRAGKKVYVEWPLAACAEQVEEICRAAEQSHAKVAVGLQQRWTPVVLQVREVIRDLGPVLSSHASAYKCAASRDEISPDRVVCTTRAVGANTVTITFGHCKPTPPRLISQPLH